jgi:uridine kinase
MLNLSSVNATSRRKHDMSEKLSYEQVFDQVVDQEKLRQEVERKLLPLDPSLFEPYKQIAVPIEQIYLNRPDEDFTLRVRAAYTPAGQEYTATLKNKGVMTPHGLSRLEVEAPISRETYEQYAAADHPRIKKLRATLVPGVTIDWIEGAELPLIEIEDSGNLPSAADFYDDYRTALVEVTGDPQYDNSTIAFEQFDGSFEPSPALNASTIVDDMVAQLSTGRPQVVIGISGMSGSGKTTLANEVEAELIHRFGEQAASPVRLSTDDYHRGKSYLEATYHSPWTNWDAPEVYDTATLAGDLEKLLAGGTIEKKHFDFEREEAVVDGILRSGPFVIVEGIFAGSRDLARVRNLHYNVPTPVATTIGRDLLRLMHSDRPNNSIGSPEARLQYQLETAVPTYQAQERPVRNVWSASVRPIGQAALRAQNASPDPRQ